MAESAANKTFKFELVSPEKILASEEASMVVVPGEAGDFGVLAEHAPLLSSIRPGVVVVTPAAGDQKKIFVSGGFADVNRNICSVLAEEAVNVNDLNRSALEEKLKALTDEFGSVGEDAVKKARVQRDIEVVKAKILSVE